MSASLGELEIRATGHEQRASADPCSLEQLTTKGDIRFDEGKDVTAAMFAPCECREMKNCIRSYTLDCFDDRFGTSIEWVQADRYVQSALQLSDVLTCESVDFRASAVKLVRKLLTHESTDSADDYPLHDVCSLHHRDLMLARGLSGGKQRAWKRREFKPRQFSV